MRRKSRHFGRPLNGLLPLMFTVVALMLAARSARWLRAETDSGDRESTAAEPSRERCDPGCDDSEHDHSSQSEHERLHQRLAGDARADLDRIAELMRKIQRGLFKNELGDPTRHNQEDVVNKLDGSAGSSVHDA